MKHLFITLLLLTFSTTLFADKFVVKSFKRIDNKIMINKDKRYDDNDELCAIVLVRTSLVGLGMSASTPIVDNVNWRQGDYWVYLSSGTRMLKFFKKGFDALEYTFPQHIEKGKFYILQLEYRRTSVSAAVSTMGFVVIESLPAGASVWINGEETGEQTPFSRALNQGYYRFTLKKELYKDYKGDFTITPNQTIKRKVELAPNYGALQINSSPEDGAEIYIDDENTGKKTPALIDRLTLKSHKLTLKKNMYATFTQTFSITAGQKTTINPVLKPMFGTVTIQTDEGDEIYIDRQKMGTGTFTGRVSKGQHLLEIKKEGHYPQSITLNVAAGKPLNQTIHLKMKTGILQVQSTPLQATIFLNNKAYGQTPRFIPGLMVGNYTLRLQKQGYATVEKQVTITENKTTALKETLPNAVQVQISSTPEGAKLYIDGQYKGITPMTLPLSFEKHSFKLQKKTYKDFETSKTVTQASNNFNFQLEAVIHDYPMFRANLQRTGVFHTKGVPVFHRVKWKFKTGYWIASSPAITSGVVYIGCRIGALYALDRKTGQEKWKFETGVGARSGSSPAIISGVVYFGNLRSYLYALDSQTGQEKWKFETGGEIEASPAITGGAVYFGSDDGYLYALDSQTGQEKWKFKTGDEIESSPAITGGVVYFGSDDGYLYALDSQTGQEKWKFKTGGGIVSSPAITGGVIYFGSEDGYLYALGSQTGQEIWKFKTGGQIISSPAITGGVIYFGSYDDYLYAVDRKTGQEKWKFKTGNGIGSSPAITGGVIYFGSLDGYLYAVDRKTGQEKWKFKTGEGIFSSPSIIGGVVYFVSQDGYLYALE